MTHGLCPTSSFMGHAPWYTSRATPGKRHHTHAMPRPAALDDSGTRDTVVSHIAGGGTQDTAAQELGIGRTTITRRMSADPVFRERVRAARARARTLGLERVRTAPVPARPANLRAAAAAAVEQDGDDLGLPSPRWVIDLVKKTAEDPEAKGQARAQLLLAELVVAPVVRARNAKLEASAPDAGPEPLQVRMLVPTPTKHPRVLDAVVVDAKPDSGS